MMLRIAIIALALATPALGQQVDRSVRPVVPPETPFTFPAVKSHVLGNGVRLLVVEDHSVPVASVRVVLGVDSTWDPPGKEGLFAVTLGALREGSSSHSADELARDAAELGTSIAPTGFTTISSSFQPAFSLMAEMLTRPAFDSAAIERRKAVQNAGARRLAQAPLTLPRRLFYTLAFGAGDPYVRSLLPTEASIASISRNDVTRFYDEFFGPRTTTIAVSGDVTDSTVVAVVTKTLGTWRPRGEAPALAEMHLRLNDMKIYLLDRPAPQTYLFVGDLGPSRDAADAVAAEAFGVVTAARLQQTLREKRSFMYSGTTGFTWRGGFSGTFVGSTTVSAAKADSALREWIGILRGLRTDQPVTGDELEAAKRNRIGTLPARIDGPDSIVARLVEMARDGLPLDYFERFARRMSAVTATQVTAAANRYADLDHLIIVVAGDRRILEPSLRAARIAPVVVVDTDGRPIP